MTHERKKPMLNQNLYNNLHRFAMKFPIIYNLVRVYRRLCLCTRINCKDLRNNIAFEKKLERNGENFKYYLASALIIKNEAHYIAEWLEFHKLVGVEHFYIYDNESTDNLKEILEPYIKSGLVDYTYFPGKVMQTPAYHAAIEKCKFETKWLAIHDTDEFFVPYKHENLQDWLREFPKNAAQILVGWKFFGDKADKETLNEEKRREEKRRAKKCKNLATPRSRNVVSIVKLRNTQLAARCL